MTILSKTYSYMSDKILISQLLNRELSVNRRKILFTEDFNFSLMQIKIKFLNR